MTIRSLLPIALGCALVLPTLALAGLLDKVQLEYTPEKGDRLKKTYGFSQTLSMVDASRTLVQAGEERELDSPTDLSLEDEAEVVVVEEVRGAEGSRATSLTRKYESIAFDRVQSATMGGDTQVNEEEKTSDLTDRTVLFDWNDEKEAYAASWVSDEDDSPELLEGLAGDSSLAYLLPSEAIEVGDKWELGTAAFVRVLHPLGDLHWEGGGGSEEETLFSQMREALEVEEFDLELKSVEDGLALVHFEAAASADFDVVPPEGMEMSADMEMSTHASFVYEIKGDLTWDLEAGHARSLAVTGTLELESSEVRSMGGEGTEITTEATFSGTVSRSLTVE